MLHKLNVWDPLLTIKLNTKLNTFFMSCSDDQNKSQNLLLFNFGGKMQGPFFTSSLKILTCLQVIFLLFM